jgi:crotonobetainyl-CoA:carnitine CoA-transferase CaiB-like acyl-CoA transferase
MTSDPPLSSLLAGLRIIDLSRNLPGPFCTRMLADLGATIIKVEPPEGDPTRPLAPLFAALNHGKDCRRIDFRVAGDIDKLRGWLADADVMLDSFRPGVLTSLGLDFDALSQIKPKLVMVSITGYGQHGPWAGRGGHDLNFLAISGALDQMRAPGGDLAMSNVPWGDMAGGSSLAAIAVLAALFEVQRSGRGRHIDISMAHGAHAHLILPTATASLFAPILGRDPGAGEDLLNGGLPCYQLYVTADGRHLAVAALEFKFWAAACAVFDRPDWVLRHWQRGLQPGSAENAVLRDEVAALVLTRTLADWSARFEGADACVTPVLTLAEARAHPLFADTMRAQPWAGV